MNGGLPLSEQPVLVIDAQATGATPALGSLLEIGWSVTTAEKTLLEVDALWIALPEGTRVSRVVRELTGYRDAFSSEAIPPELAWQGLVDASAHASIGMGKPVPTVIHFSRFEETFLRDWQQRFDAPSDRGYPFDVVCLHAVAKRLYPGLPRSGLRALAGYLGFGASLERRVRGHVDASVHVWRSMVRELIERGVHDWQELVAFASEPAPRPSTRAFPLPTSVRKALPQGPGVYRFRRSNGDILYVGKARSLKKRVQSHFTSAPRNGERAMEMLTQVRDLDVTETATPLEAALLECDEIKRLDPPYNIHLREREAWFTNRTLDESVSHPDEIGRAHV